MQVMQYPIHRPREQHGIIPWIGTWEFSYKEALFAAELP